MSIGMTVGMIRRMITGDINDFCSETTESYNGIATESQCFNDYEDY